MAAAAFLLGMPAEAYYHYTYYFNGNRANPIRARFGVGNGTAGTTITFTVNDSGPANYGSGDSFGSLLAEVRQAIAAWNQVSASQVKLAFGGLEQFPQNENSPGADITFTDLPPGLLGYASPNLPARPALQTDANGQYIPIQRSTIVLTNDTSQAPGPTYTEGFFTTAVHEIGHALGLQHTWTGAAMTPSVVGRNTNRSRPIDADDIAGLLVLYGAQGWTSKYGAISGRVTFTNNTQVSMASVVALPLTGPPVSTLTNPDGSFTISGLPTNNNPYYVYVHPLPPDAIPSNAEGLLLPEDQNGATTSQPNGAFQTIFFPSSLNPTNGSALSLTVNPGAQLSGINFSVRSQNSVPLYDVSTWSYLDPGVQNYTSMPASVYINMSPAFVNAKQGQVLVAAVANSGSMPTPQSVTILGGFAPAPSCSSNGNVSPCFTTSGGSLFAYFNPPLTAGLGPRHMIFNFGNDLFVLPDGVTLVQQQPPYINAVNPNTDGTVTITGTGLATDTAIYFDGLAVPGTFNAGTITVTPPPGNSGQVSVVAAYNSDGQNSTFLQYPGSPISTTPTYSYSTTGTPSIQVNTPALPTASPNGFSAMVNISGSNTNFVNGQVAVGFGTSDVTVSRVWVLDPTHLLANVVVAPNAAITQTEVSVISGFQVASQPFGFQIQPADPARPVIAAVVNGVPGQATIYPGTTVVVYGANLPGTPASAQVTLTPPATNMQLAAIQPSAIQPLSAASGQVNFQVPNTFPTGPAVLTIGNGSETTSLVLPISQAPPVIASIVNLNNAFIDSTHAAGTGDVLTITANGLDPTVAANPSRLQVTLGGIPMPIQSINGSQIQFVLNHNFGGSPEPVLLIVDGSASLPYTILTR